MVDESVGFSYAIMPSMTIWDLEFFILATWIRKFDTHCFKNTCVYLMQQSTMSICNLGISHSYNIAQNKLHLQSFEQALVKYQCSCK